LFFNRNLPDNRIGRISTFLFDRLTTGAIANGINENGDEKVETVNFSENIAAGLFSFILSPGQNFFPPARQKIFVTFRLRRKLKKRSIV
jgi:hypothetical protein